MEKRFTAVAMLAVLALSLVSSPARADDPIFELARRSTMVAGDDATATVSVWADGQVLVHRPAYLKRSGDYRTQLSERELQALIERIAAQQLSDLTVEDIKAARSSAATARRQRAAGAAPEVHTIVTDPDSVTLTLRLAAGPARTSGTHVLSYLGVRNDAVAWPEVAELARLDAAVTELSALIHHASLEKVP